MSWIPFTQYLLPDGRTKPVRVFRPGPITAKAKRIIDAGYRFEIEVLSTGDVSATIFDPVDEVDVAIEVCANGPQLHARIDKMIGEFTIPPGGPGTESRTCQEDEKS